MTQVAMRTWAVEVTEFEGWTDVEIDQIVVTVEIEEGPDEAESVGFVKAIRLGLSSEWAEVTAVELAA